MKILAIECSATPASCTVIENGKVIAEAFVNVKLTHSQTLLPMVDSILKSALLCVRDIDAFAIAAGPGSFTGVRIGISAVKGLTAAEKKPCCAVSTLLSMAYRLRHLNTVVCAVMDARCSQVYNALFKCENGKITRLCEDRALSVNDLLEEVKALKDKYSLPVTVIGDGAEMFYSLTEDLPFVRLTDETLRFQHATGVALAAEVKIAQGDTLPPEKLMPFYLRLPQAERELRSKQNSN